MKDKLGFDVTDANTIAASDSVGAFLRASDGTLLTHTDNAGKKSLDVHVANTISVTNAANYAEDTAHVTADIGTFTLSRRADTPTSSAGTNGDYAAFNTDADGRLYTQIHDGGNSITVDGTVELGATTLAALETITVLQGTSPWVVGDGGGSLTVDSTDLDIRDLTHVSDSVKVGDGTDFWAIDSTGLGRVADYFTTALNTATAIDNTAGGTALIGSALANRTEMFIQNHGNLPVYLGTGTVTTANGFRLSPGSILEIRVGAALSLKAIAPTSSAQSIRILEFSN